jgi:glycosyltransferase involved in cell wall biosynthesis
MGIESLTNCTQNWYHRVIPNYFDLDDFDYSENKKNYILYLGRVNAGKGVDIAIQATEKAQIPLIVAGSGSIADLGYSSTPAHVTEFGYADYHQRRRLLSEARALIIGSKYLEPFAGVQVEAWLSGTPVISPDWAAFAEYNIQGETGFRCQMFRDFVSACTLADTLSPRRCRRHGEQFSLESIGPKFDRYFQDILDVKHGQGWYTFKSMTDDHPQ